MNDFSNLEKTIVRELSCRLCLCTDVVKLKPLSAEIKRKIKRLFDIVVRGDDNLPKAICHDCLQQLSVMHLYSVKVEKTQKFLDFYKHKVNEDKVNARDPKLQPIISPRPTNESSSPTKATLPISIKSENEQGDVKTNLTKNGAKKSNNIKFMEALTLEEFAKTEKLDAALLRSTSPNKLEYESRMSISPKKEIFKKEVNEPETSDVLDSIVLTDGRPAKQGEALDRQITLFYRMECCICHESGFHFRSLMKHYKERHGVPGYVTCCDKKFHYFFPKKIIEHMAYHLQPNIFMCSSCHQNFQTSQELVEHQVNGGRSEGKILCPRCPDRYPTYRELGWHITSHRTPEKNQCDYCGKILKHHHRKKTVNHMEDIVLCSHCTRALKTIERHEKEIKEKVKPKNTSEAITLQKYKKFNQAMGLSGDEGGSTD